MVESEALAVTVAEMLDASHMAHNYYRNAVAERRSMDAAASLRAALLARQAADAADPQHTDPAWHDEAKKFPHLQLMAFYAAHLNG